MCVVIPSFFSRISFAAEKKDIQCLTHYITGLIEDRQGDTERAISEYKETLRLDPDSYVVHISLAAAYLKKSDINSAIEELNLAVNCNPEAVEPHSILAILYSLQNKTDLANKEYELAIKNASRQDPKNISLYKTLGLFYLRQNKLPDALAAFKLVIETDSNDGEAYFFIANIYDRMGDRKTTEDYLKKTLQLNPDYAEALNYLGYMYVQDGRELEQAESLIRRALKIDPDNGAYIDSLGWLYFKKGMLHKARKELERAVTLLKDPEVFEHLGDVFFKLGDIDKARENWQQSLSLDPNRETVKKKISQLPQLIAK